MVGMQPPRPRRPQHGSKILCCSLSHQLCKWDSPFRQGSVLISREKGQTALPPRFLRTDFYFLVFVFLTFRLVCLRLHSIISASPLQFTFLMPLRLSISSGHLPHPTPLTCFPKHWQGQAESQARCWGVLCLPSKFRFSPAPVGASPPSRPHWHTALAQHLFCSCDGWLCAGSKDRGGFPARSTQSPP